MSQKTLKNSVIKKVESSDRYQKFLQNLQSKYQGVSTGEKYFYDLDKQDGLYTVSINIEGVQNETITVSFKISDKDGIIDTETSVGLMPGRPKTQMVEEYVEEKKTITDRISESQG